MLDWSAGPAYINTYFSHTNGLNVLHYDGSVVFFAEGTFAPEPGLHRFHVGAFLTARTAGLPIVRSLKILEGQTRMGAFKKVLVSIHEDVESGSSLSEAMAKHPDVVITGGTTILEGMPELAEQIFNLPVRRGAPQKIGTVKGRRRQRQADVALSSTLSAFPAWYNPVRYESRCLHHQDLPDLWNPAGRRCHALRGVRP